MTRKSNESFVLMQSSILFDNFLICNQHDTYYFAKNYLPSLKLHEQNIFLYS